ncbi:acylphosphatase [Chloroflexota bacterium]
MADLASVRATVYGQVQGVGFRYFTSKYAAALNLTGFVHNLPDGEAVEVIAEGERGKLEQFISQFRSGPGIARVERIETDWSEYTGSYPDFSIRH